MDGEMTDEIFYDTDLADELRRYKPSIELRPKGFGITGPEYGDIMGYESHWGNDVLLSLHRSGEYDRKRMRDFDGQIRWVYYKDSSA